MTNPPPKYPHSYVRADVADRLGQPFICRCGRAGLAEGVRGSGCAAAMRERIATLDEECEALRAQVAEAADAARRAERMDTLACGSNLVNEYLAKNGGGGDYCNALHRLIGMVACGAHEGAHEGAATPK